MKDFMFVKFTLSLFAVVLLVTACRQKNESPDEKMQKALSGTWTFEAKYGEGSINYETMTIAPDGGYSVKINIPRRTNGPRDVILEGTFRVESGFLIDTLTNHSETNAPVPSTNRSRIVRLDGRELALQFEKVPGIGYPTNDVVYVKQEK